MQGEQKGSRRGAEGEQKGSRRGGEQKGRGAERGQRHRQHQPGRRAAGQTDGKPGSKARIPLIKKSFVTPKHKKKPLSDNNEEGDPLPKTQAARQGEGKAGQAGSLYIYIYIYIYIHTYTHTCCPPPSCPPPPLQPSCRPGVFETIILPWPFSSVRLS